MLLTIRVIRFVLGLIALWQVVGLLPVLTNWLPSDQAPTGGMWAIVFVKTVVLFLSGGAYYWLGRIKQKYDNPNAPTSERPAILIAVSALIVAGIAAAFFIPSLDSNPARSQENTAATSTLEPAPAPTPQTTYQDSAPAPASSASTMKQCLDMYATASSSVGNMEILTGLCTTAFDPNAHAVDRARSLCQVQRWTEQSDKAPQDVSMDCYRDNPLPTCPTGQSFELHNKRCEVTCYHLNGYAPDPSGQQCTRACPDGTQVIYTGTATHCLSNG